MDDKLSSALKSLPRHAARPGFDDAVWRRIEERGLEERTAPRRGPWTRWPVRLAVAAACLTLVLLGGREWWHHHQRQQTVARLTALENEHRALVAELEALRRQLTRAEPVVYLGGNNELDLVLDLAELQRAGLRPGDIAARNLATGKTVAAAGRPDWFREPGDPPSELRPTGPGRGGVRPASFEMPRQPTVY